MSSILPILINAIPPARPTFSAPTATWCEPLPGRFCLPAYFICSGTCPILSILCLLVSHCTVRCCTVLIQSSTLYGVYTCIWTRLYLVGALERARMSTWPILIALCLPTQVPTYLGKWWVILDARPFSGCLPGTLCAWPTST
jgi:hypothetical protein